MLYFEDFEKLPNFWCTESTLFFSTVFISFLALPWFYLSGTYFVSSLVSVISSQSVSLTQYMVLSVRLHVRPFQLAS